MGQGSSSGLKFQQAGLSCAGIAAAGSVTGTIATAGTDVFKISRFKYTFQGGDVGLGSQIKGHFLSTAFFDEMNTFQVESQVLIETITKIPCQAKVIQIHQVNDFEVVIKSAFTFIYGIRRKSEG